MKPTDYAYQKILSAIPSLFNSIKLHTQAGVFDIKHCGIKIIEMLVIITYFCSM